MAILVAGIDVSKRALDIHLDGRDETATNDTDGFRKVARLLREGNAERVVMEATGGWDAPGPRTTGASGSSW